jgi:hypothetical protein
VCNVHLNSARCKAHYVISLDYGLERPRISRKSRENVYIKSSLG